MSAHSLPFDLGPTIQPFHPRWVPAGGATSVRMGIYLDVVTIPGTLGQQIADQLIQLFDCHPGGIYQNADAELVHFAAEPKTTNQFRWSPGIGHYGGAGTLSVEVPALDCAPFPWSWLSLPTHRREFVDCQTLHALVQRRNDPGSTRRTPAPPGTSPRSSSGAGSPSYSSLGITSS
ncbi:hypothetical protein [Streptomyces sp. NPDC056387]|uniref:hypothetical protein n=1 Tax=Streptomyces sp. NPDC056387 TaxID=3345803 RepID=UPI0035E0B3A3